MITGIGYVDPPEAICGNALGGGEVAEALSFPPQLTDEVSVRVEHVDAVLPFVWVGRQGEMKERV